jgi:glycosyltransferase involved in cell wall biosynthesis
MKICLVSQEYPPESGGGIATQTYLKAHGLTRRGHTVHVVSTSGEAVDRVHEDGSVVVHRMADVVPTLPGNEPSTYWLMYSLRLAERIQRLHEEVGFDLLHFPEYCGEGFAFQTNTFAHRSCPYVVQLHGPLAMFRDFMGWPEPGSTAERVGCFMERMAIHHADKLVASSVNTARFVAEEYGCPLEQISVIYSGIDTDRYRPQPPPPDERFPRVLFVGGLKASKGLVKLLRLVPTLASTWPRICLRIIGSGDEADRRLVQDFVAADEGGHLEYLGFVPYEDLPEHYRWCDLFAGPSEYEPGPGNVYLEAMASGRPVVACRSGGTPEVVQDGVTGLLVDFADEPGLAAAIARLASDEALRRALGDRGRRTAVERFSEAHYIDTVERVYMELGEAWRRRG